MSKRCAFFASSTVSVFNTSPSSAAIALVSSVMKFWCTHAERCALLPEFEQFRFRIVEKCFGFRDGRFGGGAPRQ